MGIITNAEYAESVESNTVHLVGRVIGGPVFDHKVYGQAYYMILMGILRKSGYEDRIRLIVSEKLLGGRSPQEDELLEINGQIRTYNKEQAGRSKLEILIFVKDIKYVRTEREHINELAITGFICKKPMRRTSPLGREICDLMIAVNRAYNKSDYIPAIAWGRNAAWSEALEVGDKVVAEGRIQSRNYRKCTEEGELLTKTAYEVSIVGITMAGMCT